MNRFWQIVAIISLIFPFAAVGYKMAITESLVAAAVYLVIVIALTVTAALAWRASSSS
jgi:hypothetical protein